MRASRASLVGAGERVNGRERKEGTKNEEFTKEKPMTRDEARTGEDRGERSRQRNKGSVRAMCAEGKRGGAVYPRSSKAPVTLKGLSR